MSEMKSHVSDFVNAKFAIHTWMKWCQEKNWMNQSQASKFSVKCS